MIRIRHLIILLIVFSLFLQAPIVQAEDVNEDAYRNRFSLRAGTVLNNEEKGDWRGVGDCLIFPYYDARQLDGKQQTTIIRIKNIGEYGIVARLRFREWARGREVFVKDIWIPSSSISDDIAWQGTIEVNANGTNAVISSFDYVVWRYDTNFFYLSNSLASGSAFSVRNIRRNNVDSTLYGYVEVIGEEKTSPENTNGRVPRLAKIERDCPNTLLGKVIINRPEEGISMTYDAVAIGNFSRRQGSLFKSPTSPYPRLDTCEDTLDQLEFQLSKSEIYAPYSLNPSNEEKSSLIITYPTKFFHYQNNGGRMSQVNNPFEGLVEPMGELVETALYEQEQEIFNSSLTLPYSVNVIGLYRDYSGKPLGIDNVPLQTNFSESGMSTLFFNNLSERVLISDYEYYKEGKFVMYRGLPAVGLILQESQDAGQPSATLAPVEYSVDWIASNEETISTPAVPSGPSSGSAGTSYTYTASGASSSLGHPIEYLFDWGDGETSDWLPVGTTSASKTWSTGGTYIVSVRARCAIYTDIVSKWSDGLTVAIGIETVSAPTTPVGPSFGVVNNYSQTEYPFDKSYSFTTGGSTSSLDHPIQYQIDWGDGTSSGWLPVGPAMTISASKTWTTGGVFAVKAQARCATHTDIVSNWSDELMVTVESVSPPNMLSGPASGLPYTEYTYSTGGAFSNLPGHQVQYIFDWGDDTNSGWLPVGTTTATKAGGWPSGNTTNKGVYSIQARARCVTDTLAVSVWTSQLKITTEWINPPSQPVSVGPNDPDEGLPGQTFTFSTGNSFSSIGHPVEYQFDWVGDGVSDLSPWGSAIQSKTFAVGGNYSVRARARCVTDPFIISEWSSALVVKIELITVTTPTGQTTGTPFNPYIYAASGSSNIGDPVQIRFVFSDGTDSGWLPVGTTSFSKVWTSVGTFTVITKARCAIHTNIESDRSSELVVTLSNPVPTLTNVAPNIGNRLQTLDVVLTGTNFLSGVSTVGFGINITVNSISVVSPTILVANITIEGIAATGPRNVTVTNPPPGGGTATLNNGFTVNNPVPITTSISPTSRTAGDPTFTLTVNGTNFLGTNFLSTSVVQFNGSSRTTTFVSNMQLTATISGSDQTTPGTFDITVLNPTPGGGVSNAQTLTINP